MRQGAIAVAAAAAAAAVLAGSTARADGRLAADRTTVGIGETLGDYLGAAKGGTGGRLVVGRTVGGVRIGAEYDVTNYADHVAQRFGADLRWTPTWFAEPGAHAGPYVEVGIGRQVAARGSRMDAELGLGLHVVSVIDVAGERVLDQIFGVTVIVAPTWPRGDGARCAGDCPDPAALEVGVFFTAETSL